MRAEGCSPTTHPGLPPWLTHILGYLNHTIIHFLWDAITNYHKQGNLKQYTRITFTVLWVRNLHGFQWAKTQISTGLHSFFGDSWGKSVSSLWGLLNSLIHGPFVHPQIRQVEASQHIPLTLFSSSHHFCSLPPRPFWRIFLIMLGPPESSPYFNISWLATWRPFAL